MLKTKYGIKRRGLGKSIAMSKLYDPKIMAEIIERIADGATLASLMREPGNPYPSPNTFYKWLAADPEAAKLYAAARELSGQAFEDKLIDMADKLAGQNDFNALKTKQYEVAMGQFRWTAERRDPAKFAPKRELQVVVPVQINTTLDLGQGDQLSTPEHSNIFHLEALLTEDGEHVEPPEPEPPKDKGGRPPASKYNYQIDPELPAGSVETQKLAQRKGLTLRGARAKMAASRAKKVAKRNDKPPE